MSYRTMTIVLSEDELNALRRAAENDLRRPRDQARHLLKAALGLTQENHNGAVNALGSSGAAAMTCQA